MGAWRQRRGGQPRPGFEPSAAARHTWAGGAAVALSRAAASSPRETPVCAAYRVGSDRFSAFAVPRFFSSVKGGKGGTRIRGLSGAVAK